MNSDLLRKPEANLGTVRVGETIASMITEKLEGIRKADASGRPYYLVWGEPVFLDQRCPVAQRLTCCIP